MKLVQTKYIIFVIVLLRQVIVIGQEKKPVTDTLKTENVTVVKTFNPTINDAFKIETPIDADQPTETVKKVSQFRIKSVPVASTFVPIKAKSIAVKKGRKKLPPQNYASLGGGNFGNIRAEAFVDYEISRSGEFSALFEHQSSQGNIDDVRLADDFFYDTGIQLNYHKKDRKLPWSLSFEAQHQLYNWYGIPEDLIISPETLSEIDPSHNFIDLNIGAKVIFNNKLIKDLNTKLRYFFDDFNSSEINFIVAPHFNFEVDEYELDLPVDLDVLSGSFEPESFFPEVNYQRINLGVKPSIQLTYNNIEFKVGVSGYLSADTENSENDLFIYPNILATYLFKDYGVTLFGGLTGGLTQNTYHKASENNPFIAPVLNLQPTSNRFDFHIGAQGNLNEQLNYEVRAGFKSEKDKALFQKIGVLSTGSESPNFGFDNAFGYVYDDVNTTSISGILNYNLTEIIRLSLVANFFMYDTSNEAEAWNLPQVTTTFRANYILNKKVDLEGSLFFVGTRQDFDAVNAMIEDVDSIFDVNLGANYTINPSWKAFIKAQNITNQNYEQWLDFPVQSAQILVGAKYFFE